MSINSWSIWLGVTVWSSWDRRTLKYQTVNFFYIIKYKISKVAKIKGLENQSLTFFEGWNIGFPNEGTDYLPQTLKFLIVVSLQPNVVFQTLNPAKVWNIKGPF